METTRSLISYIHGLDHHPGQEPLVQPILAPRFALSCTPDLLTALGDLAALDSTLRIETHISENKAEVAETLKEFPEAKSYADVYDRYRLLRHNTILGHAVHLTEDEVELIRDRGAGISHCPTSNFNLNSGIAPIGYYLDKGVKVGCCRDSLCLIFIHLYYFLGWVRHRRFWWIFPFYPNYHPTCQDRVQSTLIQ